MSGSKSSIRYKLGMVFIIFGIISPAVGFIVPFLGLSQTLAVSLVGIFFIGAPEVFLILGAALAGKEAMIAIKTRVKDLFTKKITPQAVGKVRYNIGLGLFVGSILVNWILQYLNFSVDTTDYQQVLMIITVIFDLMILSAFFIMGEQFCEKIKKIFIWEPGFESKQNKI